MRAHAAADYHQGTGPGSAAERGGIPSRRGQFLAQRNAHHRQLGAAQMATVSSTRRHAAGSARTGARRDRESVRFVQDDRHALQPRGAARAHRGVGAHRQRSRPIPAYFPAHCRTAWTASGRLQRFPRKPRGIPRSALRRRDRQPCAPLSVSRPVSHSATSWPRSTIRAPSPSRETRGRRFRQKPLQSSQRPTPSRLARAAPEGDIWNRMKPRGTISSMKTVRARWCPCPGELAHAL
jgi:hypothetical protein